MNYGIENVFKKKNVSHRFRKNCKIDRTGQMRCKVMQDRESNRNKSWGDKRNRCNLFLCFHDQVYRQTLTSRAADTGIGLLSPV